MSTVWVCLLDIRKAFDSVWIPGMLYTLYQTGIDGKLWRIIKDMTMTITIFYLTITYKLK